MGVFTRKTKTGKTWYIQYTLKGKQVQEAVKLAFTASQARAELAKKKTEIKQAQARGLWGGGISDATVSKMCDAFLDYSAKHKRSCERDRGLVMRIKEALGDRRAVDVTPTDILNYVAKRKGDTWKGKPTSPSTINKELTCLKSAFNHFIRDGKLMVNPVSKVRKQTENNERDRVLSPAEYDAYMKAAPDWFAALAVLTCNTGARKGELLTLTWADVDLFGGVIKILGGHAKNKETRRVPLNQDAKKALLFFQRGASAAIGPVFIRPDGKPITRFLADYYHRATCRKAGIEGFTWHDWRHCFVTAARRAGKQDRSIMKVVGHKTDSMLRRYDKVDWQDLKAVVADLDMGRESNGENNGEKSADPEGGL
ncbi:MAG TPA: site-specific integrase [bacterium]|nr:site-specific integrase [bacterium]